MTPKKPLWLCAMVIAGTALAAGCASVGRTPGLLREPSFLSDLARGSPNGAHGITLVAPASGVDADKVRRAHRLAERFGFNLPQGALQPDLIPYNANSDDARLSFLAQALADPETRVVWALRGGYGSSRILENLSRLPAAKDRKIFIGYSDMTFLHLYLQKKGWKTIHGAMFLEMANPKKDADNFRLLAGLISGRLPELHYQGLQPLNQAAIETVKPIRGTITGGNLTCLAASLGTSWPLEASGKILFLEDVKEPGYKTDRLLTQLRAAGRFNGVKAVILGSFSQGDEHTEFALERFAHDLKIPVFRSDQFGHGEKNYPLVFNSPAMIEANPVEGGLFDLKIETDNLP